MWLKVLNVSNRTSKLGPSPDVSGNVLNRDRLKFNRAGKTIASFPALPKPWFAPPFHGAVGLENELVLNQAVLVFG